MLRIISHPYTAGFVVLLGAWLRFHALVQDIRLQPDEALFSTFARAAALNGDWWLPGPLDKPPLAIYLNALAQLLAGNSELAARLPGLLASILLMPVMFALARSLYSSGSNGSVPLIALLLTALSPYALAFSATAFTDGPMLLLMALALWMAAARRWGWAGLWLGLAFASKPQALFYLPLLLVLGWGINTLSWRGVLRFGLTFGLPCVLLLLWDSARPGTSLFALAAANNNPARLIRSAEVLPRLLVWLEQAQLLLGPGWMTMALGVLALLVHGVRSPRERDTELVLLNFIAVYGFLHWLVAFNTFDRYLLPVLPPVVLLAARGLASFIILTRLPVFKFIVPVMVGLALLPTAITASEGRGLTNNGHSDYARIDELAGFLNQQPVATIIYDHWLGWELGYYLGQWHDKRLTYYPTPNALVCDALTLSETGPRYLPVPKSKSPGPWLAGLSSAGFIVETAYENENFAAYRLIPPEVRGALRAEAGAGPCDQISHPAIPFSPSQPDNAAASP